MRQLFRLSHLAFYYNQRRCVAVQAAIHEVRKLQTVHIYEKYLHYLTHCFAIRRIKHDKEITSVLSDCIKVVVGQDLSKEIKHILSESVWDMWSDEDDLSLVIQSLSVSHAGTVTIKWLDETEDSTELESYTPRRKIKECNTTMMTKEEKEESQCSDSRGYRLARLQFSLI